MQVRKIAGTVIKTGLSVILTIVLLEAALILLDPYLFKGFFQYDSDLGFRVRPRAPTPPSGTLTNQFGFNAKDYPLSKASGTFRVLIIGDSFNWAGGRDGNYTALLERMFERRDNAHKIDVINAGYPMTHTGEELAMLKKFGLQYNPDLVVLGFFAGNDFSDADPDRKRIVVNDLLIDISKRKEVRLLGYPIIPQSRLLLFIEQKYKIYRELRKAKKEGQDKLQKGYFSEDTYLGIERSRLEFFRTGVPPAPANVDYIFQSISEMNELLRSRKIKFVVAIYPDEFQVNEAVLKAVFEKYKLRPEDYDLELAQHLLRGFLESKNIPYIDFLDRFRTEGQKRDLYRFRDTHWNADGNQLAADILFEKLTPWIKGPGY